MSSLPAGNATLPANFVTNPAPRAAVPVVAAVEQSVQSSAEPRQRALIPATSLPLKLNESEVSRGLFEWPEGMKSPPVEPPPAAQSPIAKRTKAIFRLPVIPNSEGTEQQAAATGTTVPSPEQVARTRALFSQRPEPMSESPTMAKPVAAPAQSTQPATLGPYAPQPPRVNPAEKPPLAQMPVQPSPASAAPAATSTTALSPQPQTLAAPKCKAPSSRARPNRVPCLAGRLMTGRPC